MIIAACTSFPATALTHHPLPITHSAPPSEAVGLDFVLRACDPQALADISDVVASVLEKITSHENHHKASNSKTQYRLTSSYAVLTSAATGVQAMMPGLTRADTSVYHSEGDAKIARDGSSFGAPWTLHEIKLGVVVQVTGAQFEKAINLFATRLMKDVLAASEDTHIFLTHFRINTKEW